MTELGNDQKSIWSTALSLLARREHSKKELQTKLIKADFPADLIQKTVDQCIAQGFLSDERYSEMLIRTRIRQGYGPLRIRQELQNQEIHPEIITQFLDGDPINWEEQLDLVKTKKFGRRQPSDIKEKARQIRFLNYRGFDLQEILKLFNSTGNT